MIRYGILGMASISPRFMVGIEQSRGSRVEAVYSSKPINMPLVSHHDTIEGLMSDEHVDIVYIPTPNYLHQEHIEMALKHGKHVICEKPLVLSSKGAKKVYELAREKDLFLMEGQKVVFLPATNHIKDIIKEGTLGALKSVRIQMWFAEGDDKSHWMYDDKKGGGVIYGSANYPLEYMMYLLDSIALIHKDAKIIKGINEVDEKVDFTFEISNVEVSVTISRLEQLDNYASFEFENGTILAPNYWKTDHIFINEVKQSFDKVSEFKYEVDHVKACLDTKMLTSPIITPEITIKCIEYVENIKKGA